MLITKSSKKILLVSSVPPIPVNNGGRQRTNLLFRALQNLGEVDLVLRTTWEIDAVIEAELKHDYCLKFLLQRVSSCSVQASGVMHSGQMVTAHSHYDYNVDNEFSAKIKTLMVENKYDLIVVRYYHTACLANLIGQANVFIDVDDVDYDWFTSKLEHEYLSPVLRESYIKQVTALKTQMAFDLPRVRGVWVSKHADLLKIPFAKILPNAVLANFTPVRKPAITPTLLFVGSLGWEPNQRGLLWFLDKVYPSIQRVVPRTQINIVGSDLRDNFRRMLDNYQHWGVNVLGHVDDLTSVYATAHISIIPTHMGGGSHIKVPESLAYGCTCVTTVVGHRGHEDNLPDSVALMVCSSPEKFAAACIKLLTDSSMRNNLEKVGFLLAQQHYSRQAFATRVAALVK